MELCKHAVFARRLSGTIFHHVGDSALEHLTQDCRALAWSQCAAGPFGRLDHQFPKKLPTAYFQESIWNRSARSSDLLAPGLKITAVDLSQGGDGNGLVSGPIITTLGIQSSGTSWVTQTQSKSHS